MKLLRRTILGGECLTCSRREPTCARVHDSVEPTVWTLPQCKSVTIETRRQMAMWQQRCPPNNTKAGRAPCTPGKTLAQGGRRADLCMPADKQPAMRPPGEPRLTETPTPLMHSRIHAVRRNCAAGAGRWSREVELTPRRVLGGRGRWLSGVLAFSVQDPPSPSPSRSAHAPCSLSLSTQLPPPG